jgi:hypothetical protein
MFSNYKKKQNKLLQWKIEINKYRYYSIILTLLILLSLIIIYYYIYKTKDNKYKKNKHNVVEKFEAPSYNTLISNWDNGSGFYSELGFKLNHYLYCKKYNINYKTNSDTWPYKYKNGWTDYFKDVELKLNSNSTIETTHIVQGCCTILDKFQIKDYVAIIPEYYKYQPEIHTIINKKKNDLGLINGDCDYGCIYIRRGDKLVNEINLINTNKFIEKLLLKYPECKTIFLQTDDYNCFIDLQKYIKDNNLDIKPITLCPENIYGAVSSNSWMDRINDKLKDKNEDTNKKYLEKIINNLSKPISEMTPDEKYAHTIELITSVDICINSKYCVCDYKSNVSRFIKVAHKNIMNVFDVLDGDTLFDLENFQTISFDFDSEYNK